MKGKPIRKIVILSALVFTVSVLAVTIFYSISDPLPDGTISSETTSAPKSPYNPAPYTVKNYHGFVAVFVGDEETPADVTGTSVSLLPLQDQLDLAEGIPVYSKEALSALLEDYCS